MRLLADQQQRAGLFLARPDREVEDEALQKCVDAFGACVGKLESEQNPAKPKTLCSVTGDLVGLTLTGDAFVTDVVTTIDPSFPSVGPASVCDGGTTTAAIWKFNMVVVTPAVKSPMLDVVTKLFAVTWTVFAAKVKPDSV